jgi:RNA polymerase sigma factor (sigma-70 family)
MHPTNLHHLGDEVLLLGFGQGDWARDEELINRYREDVARWVSRCCDRRHWDEAQELTWLNLRNIQDRTTIRQILPATNRGTGYHPEVRAYICTVARRAASKLQRKRSREQSLTDADIDGDPQHRDNPVVQAAEQSERLARLVRAISSLPPEQQAVLLLTRPNDQEDPKTSGLGTMTQKQVARLLGLTAKQFRERLIDAISKLKELMQ